MIGSLLWCENRGTRLETVSLLELMRFPGRFARYGPDHHGGAPMTVFESVFE